MKFTTIMPTEGQFIVIWKHSNRLWSSTVKWKHSMLFACIPAKGEWEPIQADHPMLNKSVYYVIQTPEDTVAEEAAIPKRGLPAIGKSMSVNTVKELH